MTTAEFKEIWVPLADRFYRVAFYILENEADAEDAVQDLLVRLWNMRSTLSGVRNPSAFGITVIRNICLDRLRSAASKVVPGADAFLDNQLDTSGGIDEALIRQEDLDRIRICMARLPDVSRKLLEMRVFENMSYPEIAWQTGLTEVNVRVKISHARKKLKKMLEDEKY